MRVNNQSMKKINFALISDSVFVALCTFLLGFTLIRFYLKSAVTALVLAIVFALLSGIAAFYVMYLKRAKKLLMTVNAREKKNLALHLSVSSENYVADLLCKALNAVPTAHNRLEDDENAYFFFFTLSPLSPDDVASCIKSGSEKHKNILCCTACAESDELAKDFNIQIKQISEVYELLKAQNLLPEKYVCGEIKKVSVWRKIKLRFNRRLCPSLFLCGLSLLFFSFFTFYRIYYIVCGGLLLTLSAVSLMFGESGR